MGIQQLSHAQVAAEQKLVAERVNFASRQMCLTGGQYIATNYECVVPQEFVDAISEERLHDALVAAAWYLGQTKNKSLDVEGQTARKLVNRWYISTRTIFKQE